MKMTKNSIRSNGLISDACTDRPSHDGRVVMHAGRGTRKKRERERSNRKKDDGDDDEQQKEMKKKKMEEGETSAILSLSASMYVMHVRRT